MASTKSMTRVTAPTHNALIASAQLFDGNGQDIVVSPKTSEWQDRLWWMYDRVGEFRYAVDWVGRMLSKAVLEVATFDKSGNIQLVETGPAKEYLDALFDTPDGRREMLRLTGIHLTLAGECYIVGITKNSKDEWSVVAANNIKRRGGKWYINRKGVEGKPYVLRLYIPHPYLEGEATSPSKAALPVLEELWRYTEYSQAQIDSRLSSAGIFLISDQMQLPTPPQGEAPENYVHAETVDQLSYHIQRVAKIAIQNRASASAMVPIVISAPPEAIEAARHITFWTPLDEAIKELREKAVRRLAIAMDMPVEALEGTGDMNHWNAWQADEAAIKIHTEPLLQIITSSLAEEYLRRLLRKKTATKAKAETHTITADTSDLRLRPNRSKEAVEMYDRGELSSRALLREVGFEEGDAPDPEERKTWLLRKIAAGSATPEQVQAALLLLDIDLGIATPDSEPREARPDPSLLEHPVQDIPDRERSERRKAIRDEGLAAATDQIVVRALERAGNRLGSRFGGKVGGIPAHEQHMHMTMSTGDKEFALIDAWGPNVTTVASRYDLSTTKLTGWLDTYVGGLIDGKRPHVYDTFRTALIGEFG